MAKPLSKNNPKRMTLTKADISNSVHREIGLSKKESAALVTSFLHQLSNTLIAGENIKLANFGTFKLARKKARFGRNPRTGESALMSERTVVTFKAAPHVSDRVNTLVKDKRS